jgi:S-DNA-T family DNA segregation ATPase FtsK/SpoIIIE
LSTVVVKRLPRTPEPPWPTGELALQPPPELPGDGRRSWGRLVMVLPMLAGSAAMAMMYSQGNAGPMRNIAGALFGLSALGMIGMVFSQSAAGKGKREMIRERRRYLRQLSQQRTQVRRTITQQRRATFYRHPDPDTLWSIPASARLWERRRGDVDFAQLRIGLGPQELATPIRPPEGRPLEDLEPMCALALRRFITTYAVVPDLPIVMALNGFSGIYLRGDAERARDLCRSLLAQIATMHTPDDLLVAVCTSPERAPAWEWVKWLPHALHPSKTDSLGRRRLVADTVTGLESMLDDVLANRARFSATAAHTASGPHLVVLLDGGDPAGSAHLLPDGGIGGLDGVTVVAIDGQPPRVLDAAKLVLNVAADGTLRSTTVHGDERLGRADRLSLAEAEALALQLAPLRLSAASEDADDEEPLATDLGLPELLRLGDPYEFDPGTAWAPRANRQRLRVPIGIGPGGVPVELDLKESAQDGMGPHGLLIGATGSGKSELLRTLVLALATTHDSTTLNFVLVDFKGGATFTKLDRLPHTSAVITNLADELPLVDRMTDAINGEMIRRQELLRRAGNYASQRDYEQARKAGAQLAPLPSLLVICDEFSELLSAKPDFIDMFVQIGRVGRSLGVHLLLASQRLEEGRLRGLNEHLSYRIGLRTFSAMESRAVLGTQDAYHLPRSPGHGYLKTGTEEMTRFKAAYVSGVFRRNEATGGLTPAQATAQIREYTTAFRPAPADPAPAPAARVDENATGESVLDVLVDRLVGKGDPAHQVWLPPLREPSTLDQLLPPLGTVAGRGFTSVDAAVHGQLGAPVGIVDRPLEQRRDPLWLDLSGAGGHVMVVGGPQSGKSTLLRSLVSSFALTHTPREVQFYILDFGGGALVGLRDLPHVGGVATRRDISQVRRSIAEVKQVLAQREERFARYGVDGMATYRRLRRDGQFADDPFGDVFLVVDGWATIRSEFEGQIDTLTEIANRGLTFGIHVIATTNRWMDVRHTVRDVFGTKLELRLGDPADSLLGRRAAMNVPDRTPGRGITSDGKHFLSALPRVDGRQTTEDVADGAAGLVAAVGRGWDGPPAPAVRLLPAEVPYPQLSGVNGQEQGLPIGIAEADLGPVYLDFNANPHFLVFGAAECGKSSFLRALAHRVVERYEPNQARLIIVDYRRSLLGTITTEHQIGYGSSAKVTTGIINEVAQVMKGRIPGPDVTPQQLRERSWWKGPELYVLVDDYDLVAAAQPNPLGPLLQYLPQARDVGLHLVLARRSGGAARAMFEQFVARLKELDTPGLVMSGNRDEGKLLGEVRASPLPPGRAWFVTRDKGARLIQLAHRPPE